MPGELLVTDDLTPNQAEKRRRAVESVIEIVGRSTVEGVSMKEVSTESGVALATLYRFFNSRDHMVAAAMAEWHGRYVRHQRLHAQRTGPLADRVFNHLQVGLRAYERNPNFLSLSLMPSLASDPHASREVYGTRMDGINLIADLLADLGTERAAAYAQVIMACQVDHLVQWMTGRLTYIGVLDMFRRQLDLMLGDLERVDSH
ncbi:TetR/AcrR family transcriptional regulator [Aeromicrobium alkaliterrae]|uniref:HTH tetR-type domain-containing protein n=1 Tax=Aeromicrobium alkaliterrae TaxID=302168 RepID=A0ABP4WCC6_9ACTN